LATSLRQSGYVQELSEFIFETISSPVPSIGYVVDTKLSARLIALTENWMSDAWKSGVAPSWVASYAAQKKLATHQAGAETAGHWLRTDPVGSRCYLGVS
jgi:hypothetical protein